MLVFLDPRHRLHNPIEPHVFGGEVLPPAEVAARGDRIEKALRARPGYVFAQPPEVSRETLAKVHSKRYLEFLESAHRRWRTATGAPIAGEAVAYIRQIPGTPWQEPTSVLAQLGRYSNDVDPILAGTWEAALASASCASAAADAVWDEGGVYSLSRPPGHHAGRETYGGYCYINNAAVAVTRLLNRAASVAVLDLDTHHGNGTQSIFWRRPDVFTVSIHGDTEEHFPFFTGHASEIGEGEGSGTNLNLPLATGSAWTSYEPAIQRAFEGVVDFSPDALVVALGVDTHVAHGVLALVPEDYPRIGKMIRSLELPTVFVQEGGYEPGTLEIGVPGVLEGFSSG